MRLCSNNLARQSVRLTVLTALLASAWAVPASSGQDLPIKGRFKGSVTVLPLSHVEPVFELESTAAGNVSHLGQTEAALTFPDVEFDLANMQILVGVTEWFGTFTVANGDQILGTYSLSNDTLPVSPLGEVTFEADLVIASGTGRFEGATGQAVAIGRANVLTRTFTVEIEGRISTVGSGKKK